MKVISSSFSLGFRGYWWALRFFSICCLALVLL